MYFHRIAKNRSPRPAPTSKNLRNGVKIMIENIKIWKNWFFFWLFTYNSKNDIFLIGCLHSIGGLKNYKIFTNTPLLQKKIWIKKLRLRVWKFWNCPIWVCFCRRIPNNYSWSYRSICRHFSLWIPKLKQGSCNCLNCSKAIRFSDQPPYNS